jgi:hypothetical protein
MKAMAVESEGAATWDYATELIQVAAVWTEKKKGRGEDAPPTALSHRAGRGMLAVYDGVGGAGARSVGFTPFTLPAQRQEFETFVSGLRADGGGDEPESALEALAVAIDSAWERGLDRRRHLIVVFTDASAHPLGDAFVRREATYPQAAPASINELFERWGYQSSQEASMENAAKRLLLFAPDTTPWNRIAVDWDNTIFLPSRAGDGLEDHEMGEIIDAIANSI